MGRVYAYPAAEGERDGRGCRCFTHTGEKLPPTVRVEFDADADEGMATVTGYACVARPTAAGSVHYTSLVDYAADKACVVTYRTWVRLVGKGQPDPPRTPGATLWKSAAGEVVCGGDPFPAVPFNEPESARA